MNADFSFITWELAAYLTIWVAFLAGVIRAAEEWL